MISVCFQGKPFNITVIQVYTPTTNAEAAEVEQFYEDLQDLLELTHTHTHTHKHKCPFHQGEVHSSSGTLPTRSNPLNLFVISIV